MGGWLENEFLKKTPSPKSGLESQFGTSDFGVCQHKYKLKNHMYRLHYLGSGEVLPLGACHWVGDDDGLHSGHGVRLPTGGFPIFSHDPLFFNW